MANRDKAKGRAKEAAGALKGDKQLKAKGRNDQASGKSKETIDSGKDKVNRSADKLKEKL